ncbi:MAG: cytochrome c oxidase subunit II transmembrane domain-containing protein, partial [Pannonibacter phragmitetus]
MKANFKRLIAAGAAAVLLAGTAGAAMAEVSGGMSSWQLGLQNSVTTVMDDIHWFKNFTLGIITIITLFVLALLIYVMVRFRRKANPSPSRTSHNTMIEVAWTVVPILILVVIAVPSFRLLYKQVELPAYDMTVKATGYQWYWGYEYTDEALDGIAFETADIGDLNDLHAKLNLTLRNLADDRLALWTHLIRRSDSS